MSAFAGCGGACACGGRCGGCAPASGFGVGEGYHSPTQEWKEWVYIQECAGWGGFQGKYSMVIRMLAFVPRETADLSVSLWWKRAPLTRGKLYRGLYNVYDKRYEGDLALIASKGVC